jgi:hypothetical protein
MIIKKMIFASHTGKASIDDEKTMTFLKAFTSTARDLVFPVFFFLGDVKILCVIDESFLHQILFWGILCVFQSRININVEEN